MHLIDLNILYIFLIILSLVLLISMAYVLYMDDDPAQELLNELIHKPITNPPPLLSDWVYVNIKKGTSYLNENGEPKTVLESDRFRLIMDSYNPSGSIINSAIIGGVMQATFNIKGEQVCGTIIPKGGHLATNGRVKCHVDMASIHTIRQGYDLTTNHLPLEISFGKALVSPDLRFIEK